MLNNRLALLISFLVLLLAATAQKPMTVEEAIDIALKNNYDLSVARNVAAAAKDNNTAGNAGMLPTFGINGADNYSVNNVYMNMSNGSTITSSAGTSNAFTSGAVLNWTLFDGTRMFITKNKLNEVEKLGEIQFKGQVMTTVYDVVVGFYQVVVTRQQLLAIRELMAYSLERVRILQKGYEAGLAHKNDLLQAKIDLNANKEAEISQTSTIRNTKRALNHLLARDPEVSFEVADTIPLDYTPDATELMTKLYENNTSVLNYGKQVDIAKLSLGEYKTLRMPKLNMVTSYNFNQTDNSASTVLTNRSYGPLIGGVLNIPIYQSGNVVRQIKLAKIQLESTQYNLENVRLQVNTEMKMALTDFDDQKQLLEIEKENLTLAKENLRISMERLRLGQTTALEVRQAQESYANSLARFFNFEFNMKAAETRIKQLVAGL